MGDDTDHALLSPSGFARTVRCLGSLAMSAEIKDESSAYADEGTAAHDFGARGLKDRFLNGASARPLSDYLGEEIKVGKRTFEIDDDMVENIETYIEAVLRQLGDGDDLLVEQKVNHADYLGVDRKDAWGTSDGIALLYSCDTIAVDDLKYGRGVKVYAEENEQMCCYALGALAKYGLAHDFKRVRMTIHQPRLNHLDTWECDVDWLLNWAETVGRASAQVAKALLDFKLTHGSLPVTVEMPDGTVRPALQPGEKQCKFCRAAGTCPELAKEVLETVKGPAAISDFEDLDVDHVKNVPLRGTLSDLGLWMDKVPLVETWCKAVRAETERRLLDGQRVESPQGGYALYEGRLGPRKWKDKAKAEELIPKLIPRDMAYKEVFRTAVQIVDTKGLAPEIVAQIAEHITREPGRPSVALRDPNRQEYTPQAKVDDFENLDEDDSFSPVGDHPFR